MVHLACQVNRETVPEEARDMHNQRTTVCLSVFFNEPFTKYGIPVMQIPCDPWRRMRWWSETAGKRPEGVREGGNVDLASQSASVHRYQSALDGHFNRNAYVGAQNAFVREAGADSCAATNKSYYYCCHHH